MPSEAPLEGALAARSRASAARSTDDGDRAGVARSAGRRRASFEVERFMDYLWAPWRAQYIRESSGSKPAAGDDSCFICRAIAADPAEDRENLLVWRRPNAVVMLNRFPYNNGHLLVAPSVHEGTLEGLSGPSLHEPIETVRAVVRIIDRMMRPQGYNIGLNMGRSAGAGLPGHLHWHVVPRWDGDTNFMPVLGETKVIVESLGEFYDRFSAEAADNPA